MSSGQRSIGHPVNVATGSVYSMHQDYVIVGKMDLVWERRYSTTLLEAPTGAFGPGWTTRYFATLTYAKGEYRLLTPEGESELFVDHEGQLDRGAIVRNLGT